MKKHTFASANSYGFSTPDNLTKEIAWDMINKAYVDLIEYGIYNRVIGNTDKTLEGSEGEQEASIHTIAFRLGYTLLLGYEKLK